MYDTIAIVLTAVVISLPGIISLVLYSRRKAAREMTTPDILRTLYGTVNDLSRRMREMETQRSADHKLIMELSRRVEIWREYSQVLVSLLKGAGVVDIPPPPETDRTAEIPASSVDLQKFQRRLADRFSNAEIDNLAFLLGIDYEGLSGMVHIQRVNSLIQSAEDQNLLLELIRLAQEQRPRGDWT